MKPTSHEINEVLDKLERDKASVRGTAIDPTYDFTAAPRHLRNVVYASTVWFCYRKWWSRLFWWRR